MSLEQIKLLVDSLREKGAGSDYIVNEIKQYLQVRALNFIYSDKKYNQKLIFTGGTCLRFCFNLPRLSEDLDFDFQGGLDFEGLKDDLLEYFSGVLRIGGISASIKGKNKKIYLKFPVLKEFSLDYNKSNLLYLKIEPAQVPVLPRKIEITPINRDGFYFYIKRYSLPDLMSGKINAFLTRSFYQGKKNEIDFKGRDIFDLIWFMAQNTVPDFDRLKALLSKTIYKKDNWDTLLKIIGERIKRVKMSHLKSDIQQFIEDRKVLEQFLGNYVAVFEQYQFAQSKQAKCQKP